MKIAVIGLWHLGSVTAACLANAGHDVIAYDPNIETINHLKNNQAPIFEPGLNDLIAKCVQTKKLHFSANPADITPANIAWITFDTPVDENDIADVNFVMEEIEKIFPHLADHTLICISSQLPVGSTRQLQNYYAEKYPHKKITYAYSPENLRLGKAIDVFTHPERVIVGIETEEDKSKIEDLFKPFSNNIIWMNIESAEMTKHALNAFLATSVVFINELSALCEQVGANARDVERGLKSEERIGAKAYLRPGNAIAGGTLARDVNYLTALGAQKTLPTPFFSSLLTSNHLHKQWACRRISETLKNLDNKTVTTLGLTYKPGTNTLRRSTAIETCQWLTQQGAKVKAYDPAIQHLPEELARFIELKSTIAEALKETDAVVIATEWPEFISLNAEQFLENNNELSVFDPSGFLAKTFVNEKRVRYFSVGI